MAYENLLIERDGAVLVVTINRPEKLNALNTKTVAEIGQVMQEAGADANVRVVVLTGAGEKAFVAGADINELAVLTPAGSRDHARQGQSVFDRIESLGQERRRGTISSYSLRMSEVVEIVALGSADRHGSRECLPAAARAPNPLLVVEALRRHVRL